jgi:hypothetical protein
VEKKAKAERYSRYIFTLLFHSFFSLLSCGDSLPSCAVVDGVGAPQCGGMYLTKTEGNREREAVFDWYARYAGWFSSLTMEMLRSCGGGRMLAVMKVRSQVR